MSVKEEVVLGAAIARMTAWVLTLVFGESCAAL